MLCLFRYVLHLYDVSLEGIWEKRGVYTYYTELVFELGSNIVDFLHHLHMLVSTHSVIFISTTCFYIHILLLLLIFPFYKGLGETEMAFIGEGKFSHISSDNLFTVSYTQAICLIWTQFIYFWEFTYFIIKNHHNENL